MRHWRWENPVNGRDISGQSDCYGNLCDSHFTNYSHVSGKMFTREQQYHYGSVC